MHLTPGHFLQGLRPGVKTPTVTIQRFTILETLAEQTTWEGEELYCATATRMRPPQPSAPRGEHADDLQLGDDGGGTEHPIRVVDDCANGCELGGWRVGGLLL